MNKELENYFLKKMKKEERIAFLRKLVVDKEMQSDFNHYRNFEALLAISCGADDLSDARRSYKRFVRTKYHTLYKYTLRAATACAAVALFMIISIHFYNNYTRLELPTQTAVVSETSLFVPAGQRISLTLSDGTHVWLNARSRLTYPTAFVGNTRKVSIEGEAFFEVAEDSDKPFVITVNGLEMKVLGTVFNVQSYGEEKMSRISLLEGSLQVYHKTSPNIMVTLQPQDEVTFQNQVITTGKIPNNDYFLWTEGIYSFNDEPLGEVLKKLERYFDVRIIVKDAALLQWKYTLKFRQRDGIDVILGVLAKVYPLKIVKDEEMNTVTISR